MPSTRALLALLALPVALLAAPPARAQTATIDRSVDVQLFHPAVGPRGFITVDSAHAPSHKQFGLQLVSSYSKGPFSLSVDSTDASLQEDFDVIGNQFTSELLAAIGLLDMFEIGI